MRPATLRDVAALLDLAEAVPGEPPWTEEELVAVLTAPGSRSWLAEHGWASVHEGTVEIHARDARTRADLLAHALSAGGVRRVTALSTQPGYPEALERAGFTFRRRHARLRRALTGAERPLAGFDVGPVRPGDAVELSRFRAVLAETLEAEPTGAPTDEWFVARVRGAVVGVLESSDQALVHHEGWIKHLGVLAQHRSQGLGRALVAAAIAAYAAKGRRWAGLGVAVSNPTGAYRLYTAMGFEPTFVADVYER
jgi:mycothiol synthase